MLYFIDTEFIEDGKTIDLISIGIVSSDNRKYYAINNQCNFKKASKWVKDNVINQLPRKNLMPPISGGSSHSEWEASKAWKDKQVITKEVLRFIKQPWLDQLQSDTFYALHQMNIPEKIKFYGYYADYDHVVLCQLFGKMIDLPAGFPMYTRDLKQLLDDLGNPQIIKQTDGLHNALSDAEWIRDTYLYLEKNYKHPAFNS